MNNINNTLNDWNLMLILVYSPGSRIPTTACICNDFEVSEETGILTITHDDTIITIDDYSWYQVIYGTNEEFNEIFNSIEKIIIDWNQK